MDNDVFSQVLGHAEEGWIEGEPTGWRDGSPLGFQHLKAHAWLFHANAGSPLADGPAHGFVIFPVVSPAMYAVVGLCLQIRSRFSSLVAIAVNCIIFRTPSTLRRW